MKPSSPTSYTLKIAVCILVMAVPGAARAEVVDLTFAHPPDAPSATERTLQSLVTVRDIGEAYATGGLYLLTHYGDREALFEAENRKLLETPFREQTWRYCSLFAARGGEDVVFGRNWDNQNVGSIIVSLYRPPGGHASISICRAIDLGFPLNAGLDDLAGSPYGERLLLAPFLSMDGINEHGLAVAVAGVRDEPVAPREGRDLVFISYLIRRILDRAATVEEAVDLAEDCVPFLLDRGSVQGHLLVADAAGRSVALEYVDDRWRTITTVTPWQVLANRPVFDVPDASLRERCWRTASMSDALKTTGGDVDWRTGLDILRGVEQKGTTWSAAYSLRERTLHLSVYQDWETVYRLEVPREDAP